MDNDIWIPIRFHICQPIPLFSGSALKIIAVVSMVIDHCAYYLWMAIQWLWSDAVLWPYRLSRVRFPGCGRFRPVRGTGCGTSFPSCCSQPSVKWRGICWKCADGTHTWCHAGPGSGGIGRFREASGAQALAIAAILLAALLAEVSGLDYGWRGIVVILVLHLFRSKKYSQSARLLQFAFAFRLCRIMVPSERCWLAP